MLDILVNYVPIIVPVFYGGGIESLLGMIVGYGIAYGAIFIWLGIYTARPFSDGGKWDWGTSSKLEVIIGSICFVAGCIYTVHLFYTLGNA